LLGTPAYSWSIRWNSPVKAGSAIAPVQTAVSRSSSAISASGM